MAGIRQRPPASGRELGERTENVERMLGRAEAALAEAFVGVHGPGGVAPGLFRLGAPGAPTDEIRDSVEAFLAALGPESAKARFPLETDNWRRWSNIHRFLMRHGTCLEDLDDKGRRAAVGVLAASLSARGFALARDVMVLNGVIGEIAARPDEFTEWLYWLSVMGEPSGAEPWGWQIDGHHLNVNCLVLGDQLVMTPMFMGSEPVAAESGPHAGTRVFAAEESLGLAALGALDADERRRAVLADEVPGELFTIAFKDNVELAYEGLRAEALGWEATSALTELIECYVGRMRPDHAEVKMAEVRDHLAETYFSWMGGTDANDVFYYRVHSPVLLIEFDHQSGVVFDNDEPSRNHIHTVVRTPNGNDYGKDLLRQHYAAVRHDEGASR